MLNPFAFFGNSIRRFGKYPNDNPGQAEMMAASRWPRQALTGRTIDADSALELSAMFRGVTLVANTIASFPIHITEDQPEGGVKRTQYQLDRPLWRKPNHEMTRVEFWSIVGGHLVLNGNAFVYVKQTPAGFEYWPIEPERVDVTRHPDDGRKMYRVDANKVYYDFVNNADGNMIHIPGWGRNGLVGVSPIQTMANAVGLGKAAEEFASRFFGNGTQLSGVLATEQPLNGAQSKEMKDRWDDTHRGLSNMHEIAVLSHGLKWQSTATAPEESQMMEIRQFQVAEAGRFTGAPEHLIGSHDKASSWGQGLEINNRAFMQFSLANLVLRIEQGVDDDYLENPRVNPDTRYPRHMKFSHNGIMRGSNAERAAFYAQMFAMGVYTVNMILDLEDLPTIGEEGDIRFVPGNNLVPLGAMMNAGEGDGAAPAKTSMQTIAAFAELMARLGHKDGSPLG